MRPRGQAGGPARLRSLAALLGVTAVAAEAAAGDSLYQAQQALLAGDTAQQIGCARLVGDDRDPGSGAPLGFGPQLTGICGQLVPPATGFGSGVAGGPGAAVGGEPAGTAARLQALRDGTTGEAPPSPSATGDAIALADGLQLWFSAGGNAASHAANRFEDGYEAVQPVASVGLDYPFTPWLTAGLAIGYNGSHGTFDDGGHFDSTAVGPVLYASLTPFDGAFAEVALSYSRQWNFRTRKASWRNEADDLTRGRVSADYPADIYAASVLLGYDQPLGRFTLGPRLGFNGSYTDVADFEEQGNTGLELEFSGLDRTSLQSTLGVALQAAFSLPFGVLVPQLSAAWVHEYALDDRGATLQFAQDRRPRPTRLDFTYYEAPDRDYAVIAAGITARLPHGVQPFVNFTTLQGNDNLTTYGAALGIRLALH